MKRSQNKYYTYIFEAIVDLIKDIRRREAVKLKRHGCRNRKEQRQATVTKDARDIS